MMLPTFFFVSSALWMFCLLAAEICFRHMLHAILLRAAEICFVGVVACFVGVVACFVCVPQKFVPFLSPTPPTSPLSPISVVACSLPSPVEACYRLELFAVSALLVLLVLDLVVQIKVVACFSNFEA